MISKSLLPRIVLGFVIFAVFTMATAQAKIKVVTTTTDLAWAASQVGGNLVEVAPLLDGTENPHYVDAVPKFIQMVASADIVCLVGLDLEIGWMPKVLSKSGNSNVQSGGPGYCEASNGIGILDKPVGTVDRSLGHVHPGGNPHFWLDPITLSQGAESIVDTLVNVDPKHAAQYMKNPANFENRMQKLKAAIDAKLQPLLKALPKPQLIEYHSEFNYFLEAYGFESLGTIEEKPGVKPAAGRIAKMAIKSKASQVKFVIAAPYNPQNTLDRFSEMSGIPVFVAPTSIQTDKETLNSYEKLQHYLADNIVKLLTKGTVAIR